MNKKGLDKGKPNERQANKRPPPPKTPQRRPPKKQLHGRPHPVKRPQRRLPNKHSHRRPYPVKRPQRPPPDKHPHRAFHELLPASSQDHPLPLKKRKSSLLVKDRVGNKLALGSL